MATVIAEIIPEVLLGEYGDIRPDALRRAKISILLNVRETPFQKTRDPPYLTRTDVHNKSYTRFIWEPIKTSPDEDLQKFQEEVMDAVYELGRIQFTNGGTHRDLAQKTLVFCTAGMHRSPLVVALHLHGSRKREMRGFLGEEVTFERVCDFIQTKLKEAGRPPAQFIPEWYEGLIGGSWEQ